MNIIDNEIFFFAQDGSKPCFMMILGPRMALKMFLRLKIGKFEKKVKNFEKIGFDRNCSKIISMIV